MNSQVYYRKWRPSTFHELEGQEQVVTILKQSILKKRIPHALLFCGSRGTGKTSTARIFSKAVNCLSNPEDKPCDKCKNCDMINKGTTLDIFELDAASHRGIEEIRSIRDKVLLSPSSLPYKVYIIDESHMLTEHASNAFLKTIEEPPKHVIFILCTTDPQKMVSTILSRCQRHDFKRISIMPMIKKLQHIANEEKINVNDETLSLLANASNGSLRDSETLLEQLYLSYGNNPTIENANVMLGNTIEASNIALEIVCICLKNETNQAFTVLSEALKNGVELKILHENIIRFCRAAAIVKSGNRQTLDEAPSTLNKLEQIVAPLKTNKIFEFLENVSNLNSRFTSETPIHLELAILKTSNLFKDSKTATENDQPHPSTLQKTKSPSEIDRIESIASNSKKTLEQNAVSVEKEKNEESKSLIVNTSSNEINHNNWNEIITSLSQKRGTRFNLGALLRGAEIASVKKDGNSYIIVFTFKHKSHLERLEEELKDINIHNVISETIVKTINLNDNASIEFKLEIQTQQREDRIKEKQLSTEAKIVKEALDLGGKLIEENNTN